LGCGGIRVLPSVLHALPLCGAAVTFFAAAKKVTKESGFKPPVPARIALRHMFFELSRSDVRTLQKARSQPRTARKPHTQSGTHTAAIKPTANAQKTSRPNVPQVDVIFRAARA
jgi:hypothetical protein